MDDGEAVTDGGTCMDEISEVSEVNSTESHDAEISDELSDALDKAYEDRLDAPDEPKEDVNEKEHFLSSYEERIDRTPSPERDSGHWEDSEKRGECMFIPDDVPKTQSVRDALDRYGLEGIEYRNGVPDFSKCSEATVQIDDMRGNDVPRTRNYEQCDTACAEQWNKAERDGRTDWTARDVQRWRDNGTDIKYTWHERNDMTTCDMVPTEINRYFSHLGGCAECDRRDAIDKESAFDD